MIRSRRSLLALFMVALALCFEGLVATSASAQVTTGTPPFGSFGGGPDVINLANLNAHISIPVLQKPGRGTNFTYALSYDSSVWYPVGVSGSQTWQSVANYGWAGQTQIATGYVYYSRLTGDCGTGHGRVPYYIYTFKFYNDQFGTPHPINLTVNDSAQKCSVRINPFSATAVLNDGSGYNVSVDASPSATVYSSNGTKFNPPLQQGSGAGSFTDRNGNTINVNVSGAFTDTLGTTALTVAGSGTPTSPKTFTYTAPSGAPASYTVNYTNYTVATNFVISGISEYKSAAAVPLVSSIALPDGSQYSFLYEATPSTAPLGTCTPYAGTTCVTARITKVILPTGGSIIYSYSGGNNGILPDGSTATLTRTTPDGTWIYTQVKGTGAASTTTITDPTTPTANQTVIQFQGIYETQRQVYQGPSSGTLLQTVNTCYNVATSPCTGAAITLPITQRTVIATLPGPGNLQSQHTEKFNTFGLPTEADDYDFATAAPFPLLRQTLFAYASLGSNLNAFRQTVTVKDGSGIIKSRQDTNYDQYTSFTGGNCITGAPQHDDAGHGCTFTARANLTSVTNYTDPVTPGGASTKNFTYDSLGNLRTAQLNCCQLKTMAYSTMTGYAYPDSVTIGSSAPQLTTSATYDLHMGLVLTYTDPNSVQTILTYDNMGRPLTTKVGTNPTTNYTYNDYDNHASFTPWAVQVCSPVQSTNTACQKAILDSQGRPVTTQLLDGGGTLYSASDTQYDTLGRAYKASNPYTSSAAYWTQTNFDAFSRPVKTTLPDTSMSTITYTDNTATTTDPAGKQRKGVSDALGRLTSVYEPDPANGNSLLLQTSYSYNLLDQLTQVTQGSQTRTYVYDALGRLGSSTAAEAGTLCFGTLSGSTCQTNGYDSFDNLIYRTDARGVLTTYGYDTLNRLQSISYNVGTTGVPATASVTYTYGIDSSCNAGHGAGCVGRLVTLTDGAGSENYTYDPSGNVTQLQKTIASTSYTLNYQYNFAGELTQITYPSNRVVVPNYDAIGRPCAVGASGSTCTTGTLYASAFGFNAAQQLTGLKYGNGIFASFGFSSDRFQLTCLDYSTTNRNGTCTHDATTTFGLSYSYGAAGSNNGQIAGITDSVDNGRSATYLYDALYRLSTAATTGSTNYPAWGLSMVYDRYGNRKDQNQTLGNPPSNHVLIDAITNRISGDCYDPNGNLLAEYASPCPAPTYTYDAENRLVNYVSTNPTYVYDGNGLRIKKCLPNCTGPTSSTVYIFSGSKVIAEYDDGAVVGSPSREYIYAAKALVAKIDSSGTKYYHQDHLSNRLVSDSAGNTLAQLGHFPFGESWYNTSNDKLLFTSYVRDSESGNDYAVARAYISRLARFSSPDPLLGSTSDPQSLNRYTYVLDDPLNLEDPLGLFCVWDDHTRDDEPADGGITKEECKRQGGRWIQRNNKCDGPCVSPVPGPPDDGGGGGGRTGGGGPSRGGGAGGGRGSGNTSLANPPLKPCSTPPTGLGILAIAGADAALGVHKAGVAVQGSVGGGAFFNSRDIVNLGVQASGQVIAYFLTFSKASPPQQDAPSISGAYAGYGPGIMLTNAGSAKQLSGPFQTLTVDVGVGSGKGSIQVANSGNIWTVSFTGGPFPISSGLGFDINFSVTNTVATGTNQCP